MDKQLKTPIAYSEKLKRLVLIADIDKEQNGLACNCTCPECGSPLVAKFYEKLDRANHFAHFNSIATQKCNETALHLMGKQLIAQMNFIKIKSYAVTQFSLDDSFGLTHTTDAAHLFASPLEIKNHYIEKVVGAIRGDIIIDSEYNSHEFSLNIEVKVWSEVNEKKKAKIEKDKINTLEINLIHLLKEPNLCNKRIIEELQNPLNHKFIFLSPDLISSYTLSYENELREKVLERDKMLDSWLLSLKSSFVSKGISLPKYHFQLTPIPEQGLRAKISPKLPPRPKLNVTYNVKSFTQLSPSVFQVTSVEANKVITIIIGSKESAEKMKSSTTDIALLILSKHIGQPVNEIKLKWLVNKEAEQYERTSNNIIHSEKEECLRQAFRNLDYLKLGQVDKRKISSIYHEEIKHVAISCWDKLKALGYSTNLLKEALDEDIDPCEIFGCKSKIWQMIALHHILTDAKYPISPNNLTSVFNKNKVDLVDPYHHVLESTELMKLNGLRNTFDTPEELFHQFLYHLSKVDVLKEVSPFTYERGQNGQKQVPT